MPVKHCSCASQSSAQPERAALSAQLCLCPASLPWVWLGCPSVGGRWSFSSMNASYELMEELCGSPQRKPWPCRKVGVVCSAWAGCAAALAHAPISAAAQLTFGAVLLLLSSCLPRGEQSSVIPSWESTDKPTLLRAIVLWVLLLLSTLWALANSHTQVYLNFSLKRWPSMGTGYPGKEWNHHAWKGSKDM